MGCGIQDPGIEKKLKENVRICKKCKNNDAIPNSNDYYCDECLSESGHPYFEPILSETIDTIYFVNKNGSDTIDVHIHQDSNNKSWSLDAISAMESILKNGFELDSSSELYWGEKVRNQIQKRKNIGVLQSKLFKPESVK